MIKKVVSSFYCHKTNILELAASLDFLDKQFLFDVINSNSTIYNICSIVKYDVRQKRVSLIICDTWDELEEPIVGDSFCFHSINDYKVIKGGIKVYHHKWQFVSKEYIGFDIEDSKIRSSIWGHIAEIAENKSRIGNKNYWYYLLEKYGLKK